MKILTLTALLALTLAAGAIASGYTTSQIAAHTIQVFNRKLTFIHSPYRVRNVRCLRETSTFFYCVGKMYDTTGATVVDEAWNVTVNADGGLRWNVQR